MFNATQTVRRVCACALLLCLWFSATAQSGISPALMSLVESERSFARAAAEKGVRASFLEYFAPDCVSFSPDPGNAQQRLLARPAPATLPPTLLSWYPIYADISQAGDLGYTTGPSTFVDHRPNAGPTYYGYYFSVWKKQFDGSWKVVLDLGTETPDASAIPKIEFRPAPAITPKTAVTQASAREDLTRLELDFTKLAAKKGDEDAYMKYRAADLRIHRDGHFPVFGDDVENAYLWNLNYYTNSSLLFSAVSTSGDLGYVYGSYESKDKTGATKEKGWFVRVWRRNAKGEWKLAADVTSVAPAETK